MQKAEAFGGESPERRALTADRKTGQALPEPSGRIKKDGGRQSPAG